MKKLTVYYLCLGVVFATGTSRAIDLKQSKVTQVVNDVQIISAADQKQKTAAVNDIFAMPDILRTGAASRAELVAQDETVTRIGANTIFSFDPANRTIDLKQGSLLFHSPHGKGGGTIHTGSATASVLGTTLIVVTTPKGGFKILDLEGEVEVRFLSGLKQKLNPGQMTFVLPGGNQLSPVIVFRLDELTVNSLLVKGFSQPLGSLPLIQNQVDKQVKQIQSGKISDTGLYAGNDANPNQVEVIDPNTIQGNQRSQVKPSTPTPTPPPSTLADALAADAFITQPSLTDASIPTPPTHVFTTPLFALPGNTFFSGQTFSGFVARNISIAGPVALLPQTAGGSASLSTLFVNLSPYSSLAAFDFVAAGNFNIQGSITFSGLPVSSDLRLIAGSQFNLVSGAQVEADVKNFLLSSPNTLTVNGVSLMNNANNLLLNSGDAVNVLNNSVLYAGNNLTINAVNDISASGVGVLGSPGKLVTQGPELSGANAQLTSLSGSILFDTAFMDVTGHAILTAPTAIQLNNSYLNAGDLVLNGSGVSTTISLDNTTITAPNSLTIFAPGDVTVNNSTLVSDTEGGFVKLQSFAGSVNVSGTPVTAQTLTVSAADSITFDEGENVGSGGGVPAPRTKAAGPKHYLQLNSGDGILLSPQRKLIVSPVGAGGAATFTAANVITVNNSDFTPFAIVNMAANTINLFNVAFSGTVNLNSLYGQWHNGSVVYGMVNDLGGVTYNGVTVYAPDGFSGNIPYTGITIGSTGGGGGAVGGLNNHYGQSHSGSVVPGGVNNLGNVTYIGAPSGAAGGLTRR